MTNLKNLYRRFILKIFKNRLSIYINIKFTLFWFFLRCYRLIKPVKLSNKNLALDLLNNGVYVLNSVKNKQLMSEICKDSKQKFECNAYLENSLKSNGLIRLKDSSINIDKLVNIFDFTEVDSLIKDYFKSDYYIYSSDVYRTIPINNQSKPFDSTDWHFDNTSFDMLKVFVYLTDVSEKTGALKLANRNISNYIKDKGIFLRDDIHKYSADIEKEKLIIEGDAGTIIFFTPQANMHKATIPEYSYRDAAVFLVYPAFSKQKSNSFERKKEISRNYGYMTDPYKKMPLRVGNS